MTISIEIRNVKDENTPNGKRARPKQQICKKTETDRENNLAKNRKCKNVPIKS